MNILQQTSSGHCCFKSLPNQTEANSAMNKSEFLAIGLQLAQNVEEKVRTRCEIAFDFASHWLKNRCRFVFHKFPQKVIIPLCFLHISHKTHKAYSDILGIS